MSSSVKFFYGEDLPLEMHKVRVVQKLNVGTIDERLAAIKEAGYNTFLLKNKNIFLDMLTDSGVNAMSDLQVSAMLSADDSYAGSATFTKLEDKLRELFNTRYFLPAHQGRACEHLLAKTFLKRPGMVVGMNYHFTTARSHILLCDCFVEELVAEKGLAVTSDDPFKGDCDIDKLNDFFTRYPIENIGFFRVELGTNLIGGQPVSLGNLREVSAVCRQKGTPLVIDASLMADNLYFMKTREELCAGMSIREITAEICKCADIIYFSARKLGCARGGGICTDKKEFYDAIKTLVPIYEGFLTYGGMSVREMEAMTVGLDETMDFDMICQGPEFISHMVEKLLQINVPVITPAGGLGCHLDAMRFLPHIPQTEYPAGALGAAFYIASSVRGMERGTLSEERAPDGSEKLSDMELLRLAMPRRVFTLSQIYYTVDRIHWLYENRKLVGGLRFVEEPFMLRFFIGKLEPVSDWSQKLRDAFVSDFGSEM
ncbi:MAG: tryptophanase [Clostridiales bacterium]|jgi:tryptophanase|nr:tryptophanase [Clostridiales bacterium]